MKRLTTNQLEEYAASDCSWKLKTALEESYHELDKRIKALHVILDIVSLPQACSRCFNDVYPIWKEVQS